MFGVVTVVIGGAIKSKHMDPEVAHVPVRPSPRLARLLTVNLAGEITERYVLQRIWNAVFSPHVS